MTRWVKPAPAGSARELTIKPPKLSYQSSAFDIECCAGLGRQDDQTTVDNTEFTFISSKFCKHILENKHQMNGTQYSLAKFMSTSE